MHGLVDVTFRNSEIEMRCQSECDTGQVGIIVLRTSRVLLSAVFKVSDFACQMVIRDETVVSFKISPLPLRQPSTSSTSSAMRSDCAGLDRSVCYCGRVKVDPLPLWNTAHAEKARREYVIEKIGFLIAGSGRLSTSQKLTTTRILPSEAKSIAVNILVSDRRGLHRRG